MTVYFHDARGRWYYSFELAGKRYSNIAVDPTTNVEAKNRTQAKAIEEQIRARLRLQPKVAATPGSFTLTSAFALYDQRVRTCANYARIKDYVAELLAFFGPATAAAAIDDAACWRFINKMQTSTIALWTGGPRSAKDHGREMRKDTGQVRANGTINHRLNVLRAALKCAFRARDPLTRASMIPAPPQVPRLKTASRLPRPISDEDLLRLADELRATAPHIADAALLVRHTGLRKAEVFGLTIAHVRDLATLRAIRLSAEETKGNRDELVPCNAAAVELLRRLVVQARARGTQWLFPYGRRTRDGVTWARIISPKTAWAAACRRLGIKHRWHDTKASFVTAVGAVASAATTQSLARHMSPVTTARYLKVLDPQRRAAVDAIAIIAPSHSQKSQSQSGRVLLRRVK